MKDIFFAKRMWREAASSSSHYDVVIVGGGAHGLATAYYLAKNHGINERRRARDRATSVPAAAGRNTTIIRSNYRTPEGAGSTARA